MSTYLIDKDIDLRGGKSQNLEEWPVDCLKFPVYFLVIIENIRNSLSPCPLSLVRKGIGEGINNNMVVELQEILGRPSRTW